ncbi:MAG: hypothetical protein FWG23_05840 [Eggerthellaceae bacterium]|jgi:hypothetical protein|nr:hypothetical protein [Eggerthellaceae bacterium]MDR2715406.1 hypothetical protein [Coriobacteriaceae bacterium]
MGLDRNTKIAEVIEDARAVKILEKHIPGFTDPENLKMKMEYSLNQLHFFQGGKVSWLKMDKLLAIDKELKALK